MLFNFLINDIILIIEKCSLYNYVDGNTIAYIHKKSINPISVKESLSLIQWFENHDMLQAICVDKRTFDAIKSFQLVDTKVRMRTCLAYFSVRFCTVFTLYLSS